ncbi:hypothetical protein [Neomegalonema sp.]|uniref:hypothetical protein n=1 Tax=Neomegalonema sp. TaxID=2039713 RepID=UPI00261FC08D|nr:hypothetical protein [Neomegalonema sp.]MDD2869984.1 hypothetical protein [Neomegalonema sp.]
MKQPETAAPPAETGEDASKDQFFARVAELSEEMILAHGKDFAMGTLVLAARWIAADRIKGAPGRH